MKFNFKSTYIIVAVVIMIVLLLFGGKMFLILDAGERYTIPRTEESPTLHAGNSSSVYFLINGQAYGPAAPGARVVRNVALDASALRAQYQVADLGRDDDLAVHVARLRDQ